MRVAAQVAGAGGLKVSGLPEMPGPAEDSRSCRRDFRPAPKMLLDPLLKERAAGPTRDVQLGPRRELWLCGSLDRMFSLLDDPLSQRTRFPMVSRATQAHTVSRWTGGTET